MLYCNTIYNQLIVLTNTFSRLACIIQEIDVKKTQNLEGEINQEYLQEMSKELKEVNNSFDNEETLNEKLKYNTYNAFNVLVRKALIDPDNTTRNDSNIYPLQN